MASKNHKPRARKQLKDLTADEKQDVKGGVTVTKLTNSASTKLVPG
jgi:hypothetical protein